MTRYHGTTDIISDNSKYICYSLVDITATGVMSPYNSNISAFVDESGQIVNNTTTWNKSRNKQRNWETLVQVIGLRAQPIDMQIPKLVQQDLSNFNFGTNFKGVANIWYFSFSVEHNDVFADAHSQTGLLEQDINFVPVILNLDETVYFEPSCFVVNNSEKANVYFTFNG